MSQAETHNALGYGKQDYVGAKSTLCTGCGHDSITSHLITSLYQSSVNPYHVAKMSGIGCSSKTTAYFLNKSHGFNSLHGRMAPLATGAKVANNKLKMLGVSGDGDTASIGLGSFSHMIRRNLPIVYIVENNGVYGLTKGQFSATADTGTTQKSGDLNPFESIDICGLAIELGCTFVARSFSGDAKQLVPLISAALRHNGSAIIDVISPCVTFANHQGSTKAFHHVKEHLDYLNEVGFIHHTQEIQVDYAEGNTEEVVLPDGSRLLLKKLEHEHDVHDRSQSLKKLIEAKRAGQFLTGLIYYQAQTPTLMDGLNLTEKPLALLDENATRPSAPQLQDILKSYK